MKASPLLRAWLARLAGRGSSCAARWRWSGFQGEGWRFAMPGGEVVRIRARWCWRLAGRAGRGWGRMRPGALAGGAGRRHCAVPAGEYGVSRQLVGADGAAFQAGGQGRGAEAAIWPAVANGSSPRRDRGGGIYEVAAAIRDGAEAQLDLAPDLGGEELARRLAQAPAKLSVGNRLRRVLGDPLRAALLMEWGQPCRPIPSGWPCVPRDCGCAMTGRWGSGGRFPRPAGSPGTV